MDTNRIKKFATEARNKLKAGIAAKIITLGFDKNGNVPEYMHPQLMQGGSLWNGQLQTEGFYHQWQALYKRVQQKGIKEVYEEAAYTWFNRLVAIRILMKNQLIEPVLEYVDAARTPRIVDEARMGRIPQMQERQRQLLMELLDDDSKTTEQFAILVTAFCHDNPILFKCFGAMSDYTELLLPNDILTEGGFIDLLNHTEFITDADFHSPELIGWLYQFYISERKDEVFASFKKGKKAEAEDIPAATQIFTPNWIVKYMVQNTIGRIYLDNNPSAAAEFKPKWQYLVEPSEPTPKEAIYKYKELTDLLVGDLACGSGHILNECFDLLYDLYIYEGYSRREAIENIFKCNLRGIDLDTRAKQLATFALMLKACQKDVSFADAHILPKVLNMPTPIPQEEVADRLKEFFRETPSSQMGEELKKAFELMQDADSLGSIMKFKLSESTLFVINETLKYWEKQRFVPERIVSIIASLELITVLSTKFSTLIANPPYMGRGNMNVVLSSYLDKNYSDSKLDLFASFMRMMIDRTAHSGRTAFITMESWMFLASFQSLRESILKYCHISSLGHFGWHIIGIAFGTAMTVIEKNLPNKRFGVYSYLTIDDIDKTQNRPYQYPKTDNGRFSIVDQESFTKIPGSPIGYWVSDNFRNLFAKEKVSKIGISDGQNITGDNNKYIRYFWEISKLNLGRGLKWVSMAKGGPFRRWYGNIIDVVNWSIEARNEYKANPVARIQDEYLWFREGITWNLISSNGTGFRYLPKTSLFNKAAPTVVIKEGCESETSYALGFLNTKVVVEILKIMNPTFNTNIAEVFELPYIVSNKEQIIQIVNSNISTSKGDWDMHEISLDFEANPLVVLRNETVANGNLDSSFKLSAFVEQFETIWEERFNQLHQNEEELNRQFIDIYGLQDELSPEVPKNEITILQQGEINLVKAPGNDNDYILQWNEDVLMKQLISYAVGVWMGRYKLGTKGLHIAHPNPTDKELQEYWYGGVQVYIDDDGLIPVLPQSSPFDDNLSSRISDFVRITFGEDKLTENLNYIEQKLGTSIDQYVQKDFWKDHKKMYQNRPIYWLFSSSKGAFKCLAFMHRMNAYTAERVRSNYLLPYIEFLQNQIGELENRRATLSTAENRKLQNFQKALDECREYHERLQVVAEQAIAFDLDDGVVVNYAKFGDVLAKIK